MKSKLSNIEVISGDFKVLVYLRGVPEDVEVLSTIVNDRRRLSIALVEDEVERERSIFKLRFLKKFDAQRDKRLYSYNPPKGTCSFTIHWLLKQRGETRLECGSSDLDLKETKCRTKVLEYLLNESNHGALGEINFKKLIDACDWIDSEEGWGSNRDPEVMYAPSGWTGGGFFKSFGPHNSHVGLFIDHLAELTPDELVDIKKDNYKWLKIQWSNAYSNKEYDYPCWTAKELRDILKRYPNYAVLKDGHFYPLPLNRMDSASSEIDSLLKSLCVKITMALMELDDSLQPKPANNKRDSSSLLNGDNDENPTKKLKQECPSEFEAPTSSWPKEFLNYRGIITKVNHPTKGTLAHTINALDDKGLWIECSVCPAKQGGGLERIKSRVGRPFTVERWIAHLESDTVSLFSRMNY